VDDVATRARAIRLAIFDVDGVMTDGTIYLGARGEAFKAFNIQDGHGVKLLQQHGIATAIISGRKSKAVDLRAKELGIKHVEQGATDKVAVFEKLVRKLGVKESECAYMGDDVQDMGVMRRCGLAVSVPGGAGEVKAIAHYVTRAGGGRGAVRELCELVIGARGQLAAKNAV
jgi:3-deoxy-D-manno-octulosonate 8-phosphate phosphatase (KDO 8-P phosphatase)